MVLYGYWRSSAAYRVRIALNFKGLEYESRSVNLVTGEQTTPDFLRLNPGAAVPALVLNNDTVLTQSLAIIDWLDTTYPQPCLVPECPTDAARVRAAAMVIACDIHPLNNLTVLGRLRDMGQDEEARRLWMCHWMTKGLHAFQALLPTDETFCFSNAPNLADTCLIPQLFNAHRWGCDLSAFKRLTEIEARCLDRQDFANARPEHQTDALRETV
ncbi:maleylacetoacetate isomerase [Pseudoruegeria sp. SK021]|uniref:maleylacetoacetate isomerase n=1 Tax=Pseudoruegeria sp. SK021 TaxID=1933035 RepID=UPI00143D7B0B